MKFMDKNHQKFFNKKMQELDENKKKDVYYKSLIYVLGLCETTRKNFKEIFNMENGEINIDLIQGYWQTGTSDKVTRMAFSLWNACMYDSEESIEKGIKSSYYNVSELFCCNYASYFYEAIKIRYPEYTNFKEEQNDEYIRINKKQIECI